MALVIVTKKCYISCEKINHITLQEEVEEINVRHEPFAIPYWNIVIDFDPLSTPNTNLNSRREDRLVSIKVGDLETAYVLFHDIVNQIREQMPDQLFLDKMVEKFLTGGALDEDTIDGKHEKILGARKAKRKRKKVLRRSKSRY